jgi:hypothetical protein
MAWRIAKSLAVLRSEVDRRWPNRSKASDGVIGDAAHAASASDHNPNGSGVVCAFDITHDPNGPDGAYLSELLRTMRHPDLKYVIWNGRMFSSYVRAGYGPFEWRPYTGADPHTNHIHVSVGRGSDGQSQPPYDDVTPWGVDLPAPVPQTPPTPSQEDDEMLWLLQETKDGTTPYKPEVWLSNLLTRRHVSSEDRLKDLGTLNGEEHGKLLANGGKVRLVSSEFLADIPAV